jgi:hypothetical protein
MEGRRVEGSGASVRTYSNRTVAADDGLIDVRVEVHVGVRERRLTRDEHDALVESLTSQVMALVPGLPYLRVPLSKVKVTR